MNAENISYKYSEVVLPNSEPVHPRAKYSSSVSMCACLGKDIKISIWGCVLYCCRECSGVFVPDTKMNRGKYLYFPFIFHHYERVIYC